MPRQRRSGLANWMNESTTPVFALNGRRVILYFNRACEELTGWTAADVIGRTCDYADQPDAELVESLTGSLCPPAVVLEGAASIVPAILHFRGGEPLRRSLAFLPMPGRDNAEPHILGIILPDGEVSGAAPLLPEGVRTHTELAAVRADLRRRFQFDSLVGTTPAMQRVLRQVQLAATGRPHVFLLGEPGTGRDAIARTIHYQSEDRLLAFVPLDCDRLSPFELQRTFDQLLQERDADESLLPTFQPAAIHLRSVTHLPRDLQSRLLDLLDTQRTTSTRPLRIFSSDSIPLDVAVAAEQMLPAFAELLATLSIQLPPLRARGDDRRLLAQYLLERINRDQDKQLNGFAAEVRETFEQYNWPGNVRELEQVVRECHAAASGRLVTMADLPFRLRTGLDAQRIGPGQEPVAIDLQQHLDTVERQLIEQTLQQCDGNRARAARLLGMTRPKLYRRLEQLGIADSVE
ncbi:MAG: helix-turn-helix domain-containing protein [Planctomycetaceae bacterium]